MKILPLSSVGRRLGTILSERYTNPMPYAVCGTGCAKPVSYTYHSLIASSDSVRVEVRGWTQRALDNRTVGVGDDHMLPARTGRNRSKPVISVKSSMCSMVNA
jgi:hypothetical protein